MMAARRVLCAARASGVSPSVATEVRGYFLPVPDTRRFAARERTAARRTRFMRSGRRRRQRDGQTHEPFVNTGPSEELSNATTWEP